MAIMFIIDLRIMIIENLEYYIYVLESISAIFEVSN